MKFSDDALLELTQPDGGRFRVASEHEAFAFCRRLALGHYENFPVGSALIPAKLRPHFYAVYAFSRVADDIGDELVHLGETIQIDALQRFDDLLENGSTGGNPVFTALEITRRTFSISPAPFHRLIEAFRRDVRFRQPDTFADILEYCSYSANPVGEIILYIAGVANKTTIEFSDNICSALQLTNFWQDISLDFQRNRMYIPQELTGKSEYCKDYLHGEEFRRKFLFALPQLIAETHKLFINGRKLLQFLPYKRLKLEIAATIGGGERILKKTERMGERILTERPTLTFTDGVAIICNILIPRRPYDTQRSCRH
ncbi:squalene synthase HpnC [Ignavibacteria bacterium]|nr:squalene/phytoene synthase family protein [Bacteroidota bacterium]MCZ2133365.1 squalene/phytoene synthase family protein [Bacteroidota bacterium]